MISHQLSLPTPPESTKPDPNRDPFQMSTTQHTATLADNWAAWEPAAAARWIKTLPPGPQHDNASKRLLASWRAQNPAKAEQWLKRLPDNKSWNTLRSPNPEE